MIKDIRMNELGEIRDEEDAMYHAFVWSHIRPSRTVELDVRREINVGAKKIALPMSRKQKFTAPEIRSMTFGDVIELKQMLSDMDLEDQLKCVSKVYGVPVEDLVELRVTTFFKMFNYVISQMKSIIEGEKHLGGDMKPELMQAGAEDLSQFGVLATVDTIAGGDILKWEDVLGVRYSRIFTKLMMSKIRAQVDEKYQEIMKEKQERESKSKRRSSVPGGRRRTPRAAKRRGR